MRHRPAPHPFARSALFRQSCVGSTPRGQAFGTKLWCQCEFLAPESGAKGTRWRQALALPPLHVGPCRSTDPHASPYLSRKHPCGVWGGTPVDTLKAIASPLMGNGSELGSKFHYVHGKVLPGRVGFSGAWSPSAPRPAARLQPGARGVVAPTNVLASPCRLSLGTPQTARRRQG